MKCWHCNGELIWCADHDVDHEFTNYSMLTELHCPKCKSDYEIYYPKKDEDSDRIHL